MFSNSYDPETGFRRDIYYSHYQTASKYFLDTIAQANYMK